MNAVVEGILLREGRTLLEWLTENSYIDESKIQVIDNKPERTSVYLFTSDHCYRIIAHKTYLGCTVSTRRNRPGETWNRGNDLSDGPFTRETYDRIMSGIVGYELKEIALPVEQEVKPPAVEKIENTVVINQAPEA